MHFRDVAVKKYVVRLSMEERHYLEELIRKGKHPSQRLTKARILLKADVGEAGTILLPLQTRADRQLPSRSRT